jgi:hypothetical protein
VTQRDLLLDLFRRNGNRLTLGQILEHPFGYEARARFTELRGMGYRIVCEKKNPPSLNLYTLSEPEANGQMRLCA